MVGVRLWALITGFCPLPAWFSLVFISLFTVSRDLRLPGRFGLFLGRSFYYFERLSAERRRIRRAHVWEDIDAILESASADDGPQAQPPAGRAAAWRVSPVGAALAAATAGAAAAAFFL